MHRLRWRNNVCYSTPWLKATIVIVCLVMGATAAYAAEPTERAAEDSPSVRSKDAPGFVPLFDGKTLKGWKAADMTWWSIEDGAITGKITKES